MAVPSWFNKDVYLANKMTQTGMDSLALKKAFADAGYNSDSADSLYAHFVDYGNAENVSPTVYFDADEYLYNKAADFYNTANPSASEVQAMRIAFSNASLTAWDHYNLYGWKEGINPSAAMDNDQYMDDKLAQMQVTDPSYTMAQLVAAFEQAGYSAITHYFDAGRNEGLVITPAADDVTTQFLTPDRDYLTGGSGGDHFFAELGDLNNGDRVDGGSGYDVLEAYVGTSETAIHPWLTDVEKVALRAQHLTNDTGSNNPSLAAKGVNVDAENITGMTYLQNERSRADLTVEDVTTLSTDMTIGMTNTDPGAVDFNVYFDPQALSSANRGGSLNIQLMDVRHADISNGVSPLETNPYDIFNFNLDGELVTVSLLDDADPADYTGPTANYTTLAQAFRDALTNATVNGVTVDLSNIVNVSLGDPFQGAGSVGGVSWQSNAGVTVTLSAQTSILEAGAGFPGTGWQASGIIPVSSAYVSTAFPVSTCPLLQTNIELDNVGRVKWDDDNPDCLPDDAIYGSKAGILEVGSMATAGGIERFDVTVDQGSWLEQMRSTNNSLRMIKAVNGAVDGVTQTDAVNDQGQLFIGASLAAAAADGNLSDWNTNLDPRNPAGSTGKPGSWIDMPKLLDTDGLTDVKVFDASEMEGSVNIGAQITNQAYGKYLAQADGLLTVYESYAPLGGQNGEFNYVTGSAADTVNMIVDGSIAQDRDFGLNIATGAGNDLINFSFNGGITQTQINNMAFQLLNNEHHVTLDGGAGDDVIRSWGNGAVKVNANSGDNAIYVGQSVQPNGVLLFNVNPAINTNLIIDWDYVNGAQLINNDVLSNMYRTVSYAGANGTPITVMVEYNGFESEAITIMTPTAANANGVMSVDVVNKAIIKAINEDPVLSKLFVAKDGAGYSLIFEALFDGVIAPDDITFTLVGAAGGTGGDIGIDDYLDGTVPVPLAQMATDVTINDGYVLGDMFMFQMQTPAANSNYSITVDGDTYYTDLPTGIAGPTDADFMAAIVNAKDQAGNLFTSKYMIHEDGNATPVDGLMGITYKDGSPVNDINSVTVQNISVTNPADGQDTGSGNVYATYSRNHVVFGQGDDVIALNADSTTSFGVNADLIDVLEIQGNIGDNSVIGFESTFDRIQVATMLNDGATNATFGNNWNDVNFGLVETNTSVKTDVNAFVTAFATPAGFLANSKGVVLVEDNSIGINQYYTFHVQNNANTTLEVSDVTYIGVITLADGESIVDGDILAYA